MTSDPNIREVQTIRRAEPQTSRDGRRHEYAKLHCEATRPKTESQSSGTSRAHHLLQYAPYRELTLKTHNRREGANRRAAFVYCVSAKKGAQTRRAWLFQEVSCVFTCWCNNLTCASTRLLYVRAAASVLSTTFSQILGTQ